MKISIVSWNVREANKKNKRMVIKVFVRAQKAVLVCLQETKLRCQMAYFEVWEGVGALNGVL